MLYIGEQKVARKDIVAILPAKQEGGAKSVVVLVSGEMLLAPFSSAALKRRLNGILRVPAR